MDRKPCFTLRGPFLTAFLVPAPTTHSSQAGSVPCQTSLGGIPRSHDHDLVSGVDFSTLVP